MVKTHSELTDNPFLSEIELNKLYSNSLIDQFFSVLLNSIGGKDFLILVMGESRSGKTTLLNKLINQIKQNVKPCQLKIRESDDAESGNSRYPAFLYKTNNNQVIILDDAHELNSQELGIILKNAWDNEKETNQIILFCEPRINGTITSLLKNMPKKTSVNKLYMPCYDEKLTESYLEHRLKIANLSKEFSFSEKDIINIYKKSKGLPGKINIEALEIFSKKKPNMSKSKKIKFNPIVTFAILALIFFIVTGAIIFKKTTLNTTQTSNILSSKNAQKTVTKKIQNPPKKNQIIKTDKQIKTNLVEELKVKKQSSIKESDIDESDIVEPEIASSQVPAMSSQPVVAKVEPVIAKTPPAKIVDSKQNKNIIKKTNVPHPLFQKEWIIAQKPEEFTIQVMAAKEKDAIDRFLQLNIKNQNKIAYYKTRSNGGIWYKFVSGKYKTLKDARNASLSLPDNLKKLGPWPRQFSTIQNEIENFNKNN